jgi:site-specific DNA recombinase
MSSFGIPQPAKRAILYARVSGDDRANEGRNLKSQLDMCRDYARSQGWHVVAELAEDEKGASGASWDLPMLVQTQDMAQAGDFDVLVVREMDRLARDLVKQLVVEDSLKSAGVEISYVLGDYPDTPEGNLMKQIRAVVAEYERLKIIERMQRGKRNKAHSGSVVLNGAPPYGYRKVKVKTGETSERTSLEIDETEAEVVRLIFNWYTEEGLGLDKIAERLWAMKLPTPADVGKGHNSRKRKAFAQWCKSSVSHLLGNETYAGTWSYGKTSTNGQPAVRVAVPAIISPEVFERVRAVRARHAQDATRNSKYEYLVAKHITCAECGAKMAARSVTPRSKRFGYYFCPAGHRGTYARNCSVKGNFSSDVIDDAVWWQWLRPYLDDPEKLVKGLTAMQAEREKATAPLRIRLAQIEKLKADYEGEFVEVLNLTLALRSDLAKTKLRERETQVVDALASLEEERKTLIAQLEAQAAPADDEQGMKDYAAKAKSGLHLADQDFALRLEIGDAGVKRRWL